MGNTRVYQMGYGIFQSAGIQIDEKIQRQGTEENRIKKAPVPSKYTPSGVELLAKTGELHKCLSGSATKKTIAKHILEIVPKDQGYLRWEIHKMGEERDKRS